MAVSKAPGLHPDSKALPNHEGRGSLKGFWELLHLGLSRASRTEEVVIWKPDKLASTYDPHHMERTIAQQSQVEI